MALYPSLFLILVLHLYELPINRLEQRDISYKSPASHSHPRTLIVPPSFECSLLYANYCDFFLKIHRLIEKIECLRRKSNILRTNNGGSKSDLKPYMGDKKILKTFHGKEARIQNICLLTRH